jgi:hypothetical protein
VTRSGPAAGFLVFAIAAAGCATVTTGTTHTVSVATDPPGARCEVKRSGVLLGVVDPTPGDVVVKKEPNALAITCSKADHEDGRGFVFATAEGMTHGNILIGGAIGSAIDASSGALNKYGKLAPITLVPTRFATPEARDAFFDGLASSVRTAADADLGVARQSDVCRDAATCDTALKRRTEQRDAELDQIELKRRRARIATN